MAPYSTVKNFNPQNITISKPKKNANGIGLSANISYFQDNKNGPLIIKTPEMTSWGINDFMDKNGMHDNKFTLSLNFPMELPLDKNDKDSTPTQLFRYKLDGLYNRVIDLMHEDSISFFGKQKSRETIEDCSYPILKYSKIKDSKEIDLNKPPSLRVKVDKKYDQANKCYYDVNSNGDKWDVEIYDKDLKPLFPNEDSDDTPMNHVSKLSTIIALIKCTGIWMNEKSWGITFKVAQIIVISHGMQLNKGVCQISLGDDDEDAPVVKSSFNMTKKAPTFIADDEDEIQPTPPQTVSVAKKSTVVLDEDETSAPQPVVVAKKTAVVLDEEDDDNDDEQPPVVASQKVDAEDDDEDEEEIVIEPPKVVKKTLKRTIVKK